MVLKYYAPYSLDKANITDAGYDLKSTETVVFQPGDFKAVGTGCHIHMTDLECCPIFSYEAQVRGRSSMALKGFITHWGTVDHEYHSEIKVVLFYLGKEEYTIHPGDKIAQLVPDKLLSVYLEKLSEPMKEDRGGFGSSGR